MKKCNFCNVIIKDDTGHCPLCGSVLEGTEPGVDTYPNIMRKERTIAFIFRLMLFLSIVAIIICAVVNYTTGTSVKWSLTVAFSSLYILIVLYMFKKENSGYRARTFFISAFGILLVMLIDYLFGAKRWSVNYVFPGVIIGLNISVIILMIVNRRNWQSYILILFALVIISLVPLIMYWIDVVTKPYVSQIAFLLTLITTIGVLVLGGPRVKNELYRRFHIMGK